MATVYDRVEALTDRVIRTLESASARLGENATTHEAVRDLLAELRLEMVEANRLKREAAAKRILLFEKVVGPLVGAVVGAISTLVAAYATGMINPPEPPPPIEVPADVP